MKTLKIRSGHDLVFNLKRIAGDKPLATLLVRDERRPTVYLELGSADVEAVLAILLRIRERQATP